jgi:hypothetical protein
MLKVSWVSVLLLEESGENDRPVAIHIMYHIMLHRVHRAIRRIQTHNVNGDMH